MSVDGGESWRRAVFDDPVTFGQDERDVWFFFQVFAIGDGAIGVMRINANDIKLGAELFIASVELVRVFFFGGYMKGAFFHTILYRMLQTGIQPFSFRRRLLGVPIAVSRRLYSVCDISATSDGILFANRIGSGSTLKSNDLGASWSAATQDQHRFLGYLLYRICFRR